MDAITPFAKHLPYRVIVHVPAPGACAGLRDEVAVLVLKDGTLALGFAVQGRDIYAQSAEKLNKHAGQLGDALQELPAHMFVQSVFESGYDFDALLSGYRTQSGTTSADVLKRGRQERHAMLRASSHLTRCTLTYWLGLKDAVPKMLGHKQGEASRLDMLRATEPLLQAASSFMGAMQRVGLNLTALGESGIVAALSRAINSTMRLAEPPSGGTDGQSTVSESGAAALAPPPTLAAQLPRSALQYNASQLVCGEPRLVLRAIGISQLGPTTHPKSLHDVLYTKLPKQGPMRLVVTHESTDTGAQRERLTRRQRLISSFVGRRFVDHAAQTALTDHQAVLESLDTRRSRLFKSSVVAVVTGRNLQEVERASRDVIDGFASQRIAATLYRDEQLPAWLASLPAYGHANPFKHDLLHRNCAHLLPYWLPSQGDSAPDLLFENRQRGLEALSVRLGPVRENAGAVIVGATNSGKTFLFSTLFKYGCLDLGGHVVLADIKGAANSSYKPLCDLLGGTYICLQDNPDVSFNPFPPAAEVFGDDGALAKDRLEPAIRIICMMSAFTAAAGPEAGYAEAAVRTVLTQMYLRGGPAGAQMRLSDIIAAFADYEGPDLTSEDVASKVQQRLRHWLEKPMGKPLFDQAKPLTLNDRFIVFDFYDMDKDPLLAAILVSVLASRIEAKMTTLPVNVPKLFGFDEAWALFAQSAEACALLDRLYRVARSYGACCYVLTQGWADIEKSAAKTGIMTNTSLIYLMRHMGQHADVARAFELDGRQEELFRSLDMVPGAYAEFLLIDRHENHTHVLRYAPTPFDLWCDTSRPADVHLRKKAIEDAPGMPLAQVIADLAQQYPRGAPRQDASRSRCVVTSQKQVSA